MLSGRLLQSWLDLSTLKHEPAYKQMMHAAGADIREAASRAVERAEGRTIRQVELRVRIGELRLLCNIVDVPADFELRSFFDLEFL